MLARTIAFTLQILAITLASRGVAAGVGPDPEGADYAGTFSDGTLTAELKAATGGTYGGTLRTGGLILPLTAKADDRGLAGTFDSDGSRFTFSATFGPDGTLRLTSDGTRYVLKRQPAAAVDAAGAARRPVPEQAARPAPLPRAKPKPEVKYDVVAETESGRTLVGEAPGARSAAAVLGMGLRSLAAVFEGAPRVEKGFADDKDLNGGAPFTAAVDRKPIRGVIFASIGVKGGLVTVAYDRADAPAGAISQLLAAAPNGGAVQWREVDVGNGGTIRLPAGWRARAGAAAGSLMAEGPDGQQLNLGLALPVLTPDALARQRAQEAQLHIAHLDSGMFVAPLTDPVEAVNQLGPQFERKLAGMRLPVEKLVRVVESAPMPADPRVQGGRAALLHYVMDVDAGAGSVRYHVIAFVMTAPTGVDRWMFYTSRALIPEPIFKRDVAVVTEAMASWKASDAVMLGRLQKAAQDLKEAGEAFRASSARASRARDLANADFDEVIRGYRTVEDTLTGERGETALGDVTETVQALNEHAGWPRYKEIPLRQQVFVAPVPTAGPR